mmetsp:Transcript_6089/g.17013  ORF Transcript_6089/g.17013 Transcript_6089/m.17013 type:complete len:227 (+) Transcript_6089:625-1305(+)
MGHEAARTAAPGARRDSDGLRRSVFVVDGRQCELQCRPRGAGAAVGGCGGCPRQHRTRGAQTPQRGPHKPPAPRVVQGHGRRDHHFQRPRHPRPDTRLLFRSQGEVHRLGGHVQRAEGSRRDGRGPGPITLAKGQRLRPVGRVLRRPRRPRGGATDLRLAGPAAWHGHETRRRQRGDDLQRGDRTPAFPPEAARVQEHEDRRPVRSRVRGGVPLAQQLHGGQRQRR